MFAWSARMRECESGECEHPMCSAIFLVTHPVSRRAITRAAAARHTHRTQTHKRFPYSLCATEHSSCGRSGGSSPSAFHANFNNTPGIASFSCQVKIILVRQRTGICLRSLFLNFLFYIRRCWEIYTTLLHPPHKRAFCNTDRANI